MTDTSPWTQPMPGLTLPVPPGTVAILKYPITVSKLMPMVRALESIYGKGLVIRTDAAIDGWMVIATE